MTKTAATSAEKPTAIVILNNYERSHLIRLPGAKTRAGIDPGKLITLVPGYNFVDSAEWAKARENATILLTLEETIKPSKSPELSPERVGRKVLVEGIVVPKDDPLSAFSAKDAVELVSGDDFNDARVAKALLKIELRNEVRIALTGRIHALEHPEIRKTA